MQPSCLVGGKIGGRKRILFHWAFVAVAGVGLAVLAVGYAAGSGGVAASASSPTGRRDRPSDPGTVWLCRPGQAHDPCTSRRTATVVPPNGPRTVEVGRPHPTSKFDCFYVYPTVSDQPSDNASLEIQPAERAAAVLQASLFSSVCQVWAPMYRQRTAESLAKGLGADSRANNVAYASLLSAWREYLAHDNHGRAIVFIGHSQGAAMLIRLLASQVDPDPALRAHTVVAILAGGNVTVPTGKTVGATFHHLPLCTASGQTGCVIAYSSFPSEPPADADFGRPGQGVSLQSDQRATRGVQVACVNPADLDGGTADLVPYFRTVAYPPPAPAVTTPWVSYPGLYSATCRSAGGATWLGVRTLTTAGRPVVTENLGSAWGYHANDINLALGNLVGDVAEAETAYRDSRR